MKAEQWKTYRTRFLVNAKQLSSTLSFIDHLGRQHRGRKGDYLVESSDGVLSIAPRRIFEDIYVAMSHAHHPGSESSQTMIDGPTIGVPKFSQASINRVKFEPLEIEELKLPKTTGRQPLDDRPATLRNAEAAAVQRKLPQPCRDRRGSVENMRLM
jgi:hypothetical protein